MVARRPSSAGLTIAARPGTSAVKVRELGLELGANPTAIYRHFPNLDGAELAGRRTD